MHIDNDHDKVVFSTGKEFYAHGGAISLGMGEYGWCISEGWDGGVDHKNFSKAECAELADYMIAMWKQFKRERS
jgi:hypothetical protein